LTRKPLPLNPFPLCGLQTLNTAPCVVPKLAHLLYYKDGNSVVMWAAWAGSLPCVRLLVARGADVEQRNANGCSVVGSTVPLSISCLLSVHMFLFYFSLFMCPYTSTHKISPTTGNERLCQAHWAAGGGGEDVCRFLRDECGVDFTARNNKGSTPLSKVCCKASTPVACCHVFSFFCA